MWASLLLGFGFFFVGVIILLTGRGGVYHGVPMPDWAWLPLMAAGGGMMLIVLRAWWRGDLKKAEKKPPTEQDIDQAKRDLARMYEREHGHPPELWSDPEWPEPTEPPLATPPAPEGAAPSPPSLPFPQGEAPPTQTKS